MADYLKIELLHGGIAATQRQKDTLRGLGLRHRHQLRILQNTPAIRGMIQKVLSLVRFEESKSKDLPKAPRIETYRLGEVLLKEKPKKPKKEKPAGAQHEHPKKAAAKHETKKKSAAKKAAHHKAAHKSGAAKKKG